MVIESEWLYPETSTVATLRHVRARASSKKALEVGDDLLRLFFGEEVAAVENGSAQTR